MATQIQAIVVGFVTPLYASSGCLNDVALLDQGVGGNDSRRLMEASTTVQLLPFLGLDSMRDLAQGDVVAVLLEPERPAHDVEQHLEFGTRQIG